MNAKAVALHSKIQLVGAINPAAWDALIPHSHFVFTDAHVNLLAADLVRQISSQLTDPSLREQTFGVSQQMARSAASGLAASWEPGDELCPPWRWPFPHPHGLEWLEQLEQVLKPQPQPWKSIGAAEQVQLAYQLTQVAALTSEASFSLELLHLASRVAAVASRTMLDEFERCGTRPRPKFPRKTPNQVPQLV
ncbi:hypothetical protein [Hymenobacter metallilatus]|uniref:Uncharacterized protein n=1 Tax=Hymenobacter metallilatus TaxID=2493666 RepID=A0A428JSV6_9BACT|nr:hypothetical protein [Hymenobacter metallilatus]RSK37225.1 hypothetical protein EI290_00775 [Hymenobacter metallilatus]